MRLYPWAALRGDAFNSGWRFPEHGISVVPLFSIRARQRVPQTQSGAVRSQGCDYRTHSVSENSFAPQPRCQWESRWGVKVPWSSGGALSSVLGRRLGLSPEKVKELIPVGAAAAIAAAFNTPLAAGVVFARGSHGDLHAPVLALSCWPRRLSWLVLAHAPRQSTLFPGPAVPVGSSGGIRNLRACSAWPAVWCR